MRPAAGGLPRRHFAPDMAENDGGSRGGLPLPPALKRRVLTIHDADRLEACCRFTPNYLHLRNSRWGGRRTMPWVHGAQRGCPMLDRHDVETFLVLQPIAADAAGPDREGMPIIATGMLGPYRSVRTPPSRDARVPVPRGPARSPARHQGAAALRDVALPGDIETPMMDSVTGCDDAYRSLGTLPAE